MILKYLKEGILDLRINGFRYSRAVGDAPVPVLLTEIQVAQYGQWFEDEEQPKEKKSKTFNAEEK